ncbi:MAG: acetolactate decarboxylase, partial [Planctomycetota bacterium]|nr:acetolactate decarboxylase [Planctomycetota bacterium]
MKIFSLLAAFACAVSCSSPIAPELQHWGEMKSVLADGETQARVELNDCLTPSSIGLGAIENLNGELTIVDGVAHISRVDNDSSLMTTVSTAGHSGESATMLAMFNVESWEAIQLGHIDNISQLEEIVNNELASRGFDLTQPIPFKVDATFADITIHVLNQSCPIADPDGPAPWRADFQSKNGKLVGLFADGWG